ncbi:MAG: hypothetical protein LBH68_07275, partial [Bifidobacteriaceae bacterium]|nr:hypothetical protein [Bifidobacteriaceae bacterium]
MDRSPKAHVKRWAVTGLIGALTACAACTTPGADQSPTSGQPTAPALADGGLPQAQPEMLSPVELPFAEYFDAGNRITELINRSQDGAMAEWNSGREAFVAQCMNSAGFEYTPHVYSPPDTITELNEPYFLGETLGVPWLPASADEVKRVGYGVMTVEQLHGETEPSPTPPGQAESLAYFESLSPEAKRAYQIALVGMTDDEPKVVENPDSCYNQADRLHPSPDSVSLDFLDPLFPMLGFFRAMAGPEGRTMTPEM